MRANSVSRTASAGLRKSYVPSKVTVKSPKVIRILRAVESEARIVDKDDDIDAEVDAFMKRQAERESGAAFARTKDPNAILGAELIPEEDANTYCREIFELLKTLKANRDMSLTEVKLVVQIEDPRDRERRAAGMEDERGVSKDEMAVALMDVAEGRVPLDRIALKCLHEDMQEWPFIKEVITPGMRAANPTAKDIPSALVGERDTIVTPYIMGEAIRLGEKPQDLSDMMPGWFGIGTLYGISAIPLFLAGGCILILFFSSLR